MVDTVVTQLTIDARGAEVGSALFIKATNAAQASVDRLLDRQAALEKAMASGQMVMTGTGATVSRLSREYQRLQDDIDPVAAKLRKAGEELNRVKIIADDARLRLGRPLEEVSKVVDVAIAKYRNLQNSIISAHAAAAQQQVNAATGVTNPGANTQSRGEDIAAYGVELDRVRAKFDPVFAAQQKYKESLDELRAALNTGAISESIYAQRLAETKEAFVATQAAMGNLTAAQKAAGAAADTLAAKEKAAAAENSALISRVQTAYDALRKNAEGAAAAAAGYEQFEADLKRVKAEINPSAAALDTLNARLKLLSDLQRSGHITQEELADGTLQARKVYADTERSIAGLNVATGKWTNGNGLARHELINLGRQGQDVFVSLASGQNLLTVAIQQGTQIFDVFASSQAKAGAVMNDLALLFVRFVPIIGAVVAAGTALYAVFNNMSQRLDVANSLQGIGRAAGVTGEQLNNLAAETANAGNVSVASAREMAAEFTKTGKIGPDMTRALIKVAKDYSLVVGQDLTTSVKELATAFADPAKGAETLNAKLGFLDASTQQQIRKALEMNDTLRAQKIVIDALVPSLSRADEATGTWAKTWDRFKAGMSNALEATGDGIRKVIDPTSTERIQEINKQIGDLNKQMNAPGAQAGSGRSDAYQKRIDQLNAEKRILEANVTLDQQRAKIDQGFAKRVEDGLKATAITDSVQKDQLKVALLKQQAAQLQKGLDTSQGDTGNMSQAIEKVKNQISDYSKVTDGLTMAQYKLIESDKIRAAHVNDRTPMEKAATAAELAKIEAMDTETTTVQRNAQAQAAARQVQLEAAKGRADLALATNDNIQGLNSETDAIKKNGSAAADTAKRKEQARRDARETGVDPTSREEQLRLDRLAAINAELAMNIAKQKESASVQGSVNNAASQARMSETQMSELLQKRTLLEAEKQRLMAAGVTVQTGLTDKVNEYGNAIDRTNSELAKTRAIGMIYGQVDEIAGLEKEISLLGLSTEQRRRQIAALQAEQDLKRQNIKVNSEEGQTYLKNRDQIETLKIAYDRQRQAIDQVRQAQDFAGESFKSFAEEAITGTEGIAGALKSLGKSFLSSSLDALINGKGALAGITGLASQDKDKQGGILGLLQGNSLTGLTKAIKTGAKEGTKEGSQEALDGLGGGGQSLFGVDGKQLAGGLTAIAGLAGAYGIGASAKSAGQAVGGGALSGGLAGIGLASALGGAGLASAAVLGPIGVILGAGLAYYGNQSQKAAEKKAREQEAQNNYNQAKTSIDQFRSQARGDPQGTIKDTIQQSRASMQQLYDVAFLAKRTDEAKAIYDDFVTYEKRTLDNFTKSWGGVLDSLTNGFGPNSPFSQAKASVEALGESLKGFVSNTAFVFSGDADKLEQAKAAARSYALQSLQGAESLSMVGQRMQEIAGTSAALQQVLQDLGMTAEQAAAAIAESAAKAREKVKETFEKDLGQKTLSAQGYGYLNDFLALRDEYQQMVKDAQETGTSGTQVNNYFAAKAQELVNNANLTGKAFEDLIARFPELSGVVHEAGVTMNAFFREMEANVRKAGYADRSFAATNDTTTLQGQLAAFEREAQKQRVEEARVGGDAMNELEAALGAERLKIITDFAKNALAEQKAAADDAKNFFDTFTRNLRQFIDGLRSGQDTVLSPQDRLTAAQTQFDAQYALAQGGNRDAANSLTTYAQALIDANKAFNASSAQGQAIYSDLIARLEAIPLQVSAEQFIVNAIKETTAAVDANGDGFISRQEATIAGLGAIFNQLDTNGDGMLSATEIIKAASQTSATQETTQTAQNTQTNELLDAVKNLASATYTVQASVQQLLGSQNQLFNQLVGLNTTSSQLLAALLGQFYLTQVLDIGGVGLTNNMVTALNKIVYNTAGTWSAVAKGPVPAAYAEGGWVRGPGTGTSDSIPAVLSNGEFVVPADEARRNRSVLEAMMGGRSLLTLPGNDNARGVSSSFVRSVSSRASFTGKADEGEMVQELRALRSEVVTLKTALTAVTIAAAEHVREGVDQGTAAQAEMVREKKAKRRA